MKLEHIRLHLGLSHREFERRLKNGLIDIDAVKGQIFEYSTDIKMQSLTEAWLEENHTEQVDKYTDILPEVK